MGSVIVRRSGLFAIAVVAAALTSACRTAGEAQQAETAGAGDRQCFLASQVNGFHAIDDDTVHVTVGANSVYELEIIGVCPQIDWSQRIAIQSRPASSWVCRGFDADLLVPGPTGLDRCLVTGVRRLSPEEAEAARQNRG